VIDCPRISVVMSVYNGQSFLSEAIESILHQTFRDFEFIIIDDGSCDNTAEILSSYAARDSRIRVLSHENKGRAVSLNIGIAHAQSNYIARMDADDIALPYRFQQQFDFLEAHPEVGLLGGSVQLIKAADSVLAVVQPPRSDLEIKTVMLQGNPMWHPTVVMRKGIALAAGGYRKPLLDADDYDLFLRMGERSQLANLDTVVLQYRIHANQVSVRNMRHQTECVLAASAAASFRKHGGGDPLSNIDAVTPELLRSLYVTSDQIQKKVINTCNYWVHLLKKVDADSALQAVDHLLQLSGSGTADRAVFADAWLAAAGIHYRQGRPAKALVCGSRALLLRPIVAGRSVKRVFTRLASAIRG
jgi:glycosyltransferase involved in cell wall biosynthesis